MTFSMRRRESGSGQKILGLQNIVSSIDPVSGTKTINTRNVTRRQADAFLSAPMWTAPRAGFPVRTIRTQRSCTFLWWRRAWIWRHYDGGWRPRVLFVNRRAPDGAASSGFGRKVRRRCGSHQHADARSDVDRAASRAGFEPRAGNGRRVDLQRFKRPVLSMLMTIKRANCYGKRG